MQDAAYFIFDGFPKTNPFVSPKCGKRFNKLFNMRRHERVHANSTQIEQVQQRVALPKLSKHKPFKCPVCDKGFSRKDNLRRHIRLKHPDPPTDPDPPQDPP